MAPIPKPQQHQAPAKCPQSEPVPGFPLAALGPALAAAARAVAVRTQAPVELAAQQILTLAAAAAQRLASVRLPTGEARPISCFFATLLPAAERGAAAERLIVDAARAWEAGFEKAYPARLRTYDAAVAAREAALAVQSPPGEAPPVIPPRPPQPIQKVDLFYDRAGGAGEDRFRNLRRVSAFFPHHPHELVQRGFQRRAECASLCRLWDGAVLNAPAAPPFHPRLALHLLCTPRDGRALFSDAALYDGGLLSRLLVVAPSSRVGERAWQAGENDTPPPEVAALIDRLGALFARPAAPDARVLCFSKTGAELWFAFAREVEEAMASGGPYAAIRPLADRLPEHAARLAAVLGLANAGTDHAAGHAPDDEGGDVLGAADLERGIVLARYYAEAYLRLCDLAPPALSEAEQSDLLKHWLFQHPGQEIKLRDICRAGPRALRNADIAFGVMCRMEFEGVVESIGTPTSGKRRPGARYEWQMPKVSPSVAEVSPPVKIGRTAW